MSGEVCGRETRVSGRARRGFALSTDLLRSFVAPNHAAWQHRSRRCNTHPSAPDLDQVVALTARPESYRDWNIVFVTPGRPGCCRAMAALGCACFWGILQISPDKSKRDLVSDTPSKASSLLDSARSVLQLDMLLQLEHVTCTAFCLRACLPCSFASKVRVVFEVSKIPPPLCFVFELAFSPALPVP